MARNRRPILRAQLASMTQQSSGPYDWMPATFFDVPPSPTARRWIKILSPIASPGFPPGGSQPGVPALPPNGLPVFPYYNAILFTRSGAERKNVTAIVQRIPLPGGGARVQAAVATVPGPLMPNPTVRRGAGVQDFALAAAVPSSQRASLAAALGPRPYVPSGYGGCWWTETGWHCCTTNTPWPSCVPGGVTWSQRGYGQPPGLGLAARRA